MSTSTSVVVVAGIGKEADGSGEPECYWLARVEADRPYRELPEHVEWEWIEGQDLLGPYRTVSSARGAATRRGFTVR